MNCKDCIHYDVCAGADVTQVSCGHFSDCLEWVHMPCKVGDTVYVIPSKTNYELNIVNGYSENNRIYKQTVDEIRFFKNSIYLLFTCGGLQNCHSKFYKINWFLNRKDALKALEELQK